MTPVWCLKLTWTQLRLYSRELPLDNASVMYVEYLPSPVVFIGPSGEDSLLVYTYDNILYHFIIDSTQSEVILVPVGQIAFNGIVRAPTRVRAISWVLPEDQLRMGDPSQDVKVASVLLLVDGNLVLLQPSYSEAGDLKYDMRVISHDVEYYNLMRDQISFNFALPAEESAPPSPSAEPAFSTPGRPELSRTLSDSLWVFCGKDLLVWSDVQDVLRGEESLEPIRIPLDFYPLSVLLNKGIVLGVESEMIQRRDATFTTLKFAIRVCLPFSGMVQKLTAIQTHLFLPYFLQHALVNLDMPTAFSISYDYSHLSYYPHALEVLLHHVLDDEVDQESKDNKMNVPSEERKPLLPTVISFLQASLPTNIYLDIIVQCTRKTELRSWRTLFMRLPPPRELFEQAMKLNCLKTAVGYLLVLQAFDNDEENSRIEDYVVRLFKLASRKGDWDLCSELSRFLIALDVSGDMLRRTVARIGLRSNGDTGSPGGHRPPAGALGLTVPTTGTGPRSWSSLSQGDDVSATSSVNSGEPSDVASISPVAENSGGE